jgi:8-oxo-dGTP pyrophosphatase MutT (NUDIX family)
VLVVDDEGAVLLLRGFDPTRPERGSWWFTPGGGLDDGESPADAAGRELFEETGLRVDDLGEVRFERDTTFDFEGVTYEQHEYFFAVRTQRFEPTRDGWSDIEQRSVLGHQWWTVEELTITDEVIHPEQLAVRLRGLLASAVRRRPR